MDLELTDKIALITGASKGIGRAVAGILAKEGCNLHLAARTEADLAAVRDDLMGRTGVQVTIHTLDLSTDEGCRGLGDEIEARENGRLDILVNNAGANWGEEYEDFPEAAWDRVLNVNVKGVFQVTRGLTGALAATATDEDPSRVINIGSIDGITVPTLETYSYSASKAAVHHMSRVLARKLAPKRITVNAIAPGPFQSRMMKATLEAAGDAMSRLVPLGRIGAPEDMAGIAIYLASRAGAYVNGVTIPVDGGISHAR